MDEKLLEYFMEKTDHRFDLVDAKLEQLIKRDNMMIGGAIVISALVSIIGMFAFGR